ncbi:MAG: pilus assembly protein N-terminal domain-containing protein, partial [Candidatus Baltobacteraceae bacterium]
MILSDVYGRLMFAACLVWALAAQPSSAQETPAPTATPSAEPAIGPAPSPGAGAPAPSTSPTVPPAPTPTPTLPPITASPQNVQAPMGTTQTVTLNGILGSFTAVAQNPQIVDVGTNQDSRTLSIAGKTPGSTSITVADSRGVTASIGVRVAYNAANLPSFLTLQITGDPASAQYVRGVVARKIENATQVQKGAQLIVSPDDVPIRNDIRQDNSNVVDVPVLAQGDQYFSVQGTTRVQVENIAAPRISPSSLMVSDYPEKLTANGVLFTADLRRNEPSRFLYFHYNPPGEPDRRIVLVAENHSMEPATVQFISGRGGPSPNEMEVGHVATRDFLVSVVQNQGLLVTVPANSTLPIAMQELPAGSIAANLLQLRVLSGGDVHLTLVAQNASDDPSTALTTGALLMSAVRHARGTYDIPEFHYAAQWSVNDQYLELPIGHIPLPN